MSISPDEPPAGHDVTCDVAVLGAGPAGIAAAGAAAATGARVALIDAGTRIGGQYWRHREADPGRHHTGWSAFRRLQEVLTQYAPGIVFLPGHSVWQVEPVAASGFRVHTTVDEQEATIDARALVLACGAYDRQVPFPGWTLPGVFTAGAVQALLKGHGVLAGRRIVVGGTGPFLLAVAAGLVQGGADVVGVCEAGAAPTAFARHPLAVARNPGKVAEGLRYASVLARHRVPYRTRTAVVVASGDDSVTGAQIATLDRQWNVVPGTRRFVDCDTVAVGWGFTPQLELAVQLGCGTSLDADGSLVADVDDRQSSTVAGVFVAGEATGVGGAALAVTEGTIAGRQAAAAARGAASPGTSSPGVASPGAAWPGAGGSAVVPAALRRRRGAQRAFAAALLRAYPVRPGWMGWSSDDTVVCRCEEVTVGQIAAAVELGAENARAVKLYARPGMGLCQGKVCGYATGALVAARCGRTPSAADVAGVAGRPIAAPITLGALAAAHHRDAGNDGRPTGPAGQGSD